MLGTASQKFVPIKNIRNGIVELDDGSLRALIETDSVNLSLKDEGSQESIITQFQNLLNTLDFSIQIYCQSRRVNIDGYLEKLSNRAGIEKNNLIKLQILEYIEYIKTFTNDNNIMKKRFIVVVPYVPAIVGGSGDPLILFNKNVSQLQERVDVVISGLGRCEIKGSLLSSEEAIDVYYKLFNPNEDSKVIS